MKIKNLKFRLETLTYDIYFKDKHFNHIVYKIYDLTCHGLVSIHKYINGLDTNTKSYKIYYYIYNPKPINISDLFYNN